MRGHVRKRGTSWELRAYSGRDPITHRAVYATRTFRGGKREADEALARFVTEVGGGGHAAQDTTVGDLIREWFELAKPELSPATVRGYERSIRAYILPTLGGLPLAKLRPAQLDRLYAKLRTGGGEDGGPLSTATVRQVHAIIRRALQQGVRWGWLAANPAALATPPRVHPSQIEAPDPEAVIALIEAAKADDPDFGCFIYLAASTGARRGELCGLHWGAIDLEARTVTIARSVVEGVGNAIIEKDTKTHSVRRIALDETAEALLLEHRQRCLARAEDCGVDLPGNAYVFSGEPDGSRPWVPNEVTKVFIRLRNQAGLGSVRLHDLRHFSATRLLAAGVPVRTVSGRLGHRNASTTLTVYAHFVESSDRDAADKLGALLQRPASPPTPSRRREIIASSSSSTNHRAVAPKE